MEIKTLNPDCEIEQLFFHMKVNGIRPNSNHGRILLWLEKKDQAIIQSQILPGQ